jgi:uncharacterized membrane protein
MRWTRMVPHGLLMVAVVWYALRFSQLVIRRHNEFGSFDYDLGIYDQGIWLLGEGRQFLTVRGIRFFGHHWNPATVLFVPFYKWFGAGPNLLNVAQAIAVSAGAIPTYVATRKISRSSWIGLAVAIAYLGHPSSGWLIQELFHPETMAIPFVLGAWAFALHDRWRWYGACIVMALLWKEDIALATAMLGLFVVWRKNRSISLITFFGSVAYFLVSTKLIIPAFLGRNVFYEDLYGDLGSSMSDIGKTAITDPSKVQKVLRDHDAEKYANSIMRPYGYIGFLSPSYLMVGVPQFFANLLSTLGFIWDPRFHYVAMPLVGSTMAAARAIATRTKWWLRCALVVVMLLFVHGVRNDGIGPWSSKYDDGFWPTSNQRTTAIWKEAISHIPDDPTVVTSSMYLATPHLTHRPEAYTFPNPWKISYWGVGGEQPRDARRVDYVVLNEQSLGEQDRATYNDAIVNSGDFQLVFRPAPSDPQIVTWRRINNGLHSLPPMPKAPSVGAPAPN